jgi:hypothetical protein
MPKRPVVVIALPVSSRLAANIMRLVGEEYDDATIGEYADDDLMLGVGSGHFLVIDADPEADT